MGKFRFNLALIFFIFLLPSVSSEIEINLESFELNLKVSEKEIKDRISKLEKHEPLYKTGVLGKYTKLVQPASKGAVTG